MKRLVAAVPAVLVFAACSSGTVPLSPGDRMSGASERSNVVSYASPRASATLAPVGSNLRGITFDNVSNDCGATSSELTAEKALNDPTVRVVFDPGSASCYRSAMEAFHQYGHTMGQLIDSSEMPRYTLARVRSRTSSYVSTLKSSVDIWEIGNEVNGEWLSRVTCSGGDECSAQADDVMSKVEAMYDAVTAAGGATALTLYYEPSQTVTPGYDMIPWEERYIPATMHQGLKYVLVSYYETDNDNIRPTPAQWDAIFKKLATDFPNAKVGFGEIGMDNPIKPSTLAKAEGIFNYYQTLHFPDIAQYTRAGFWWYGGEDLAPCTKWPAFFSDVQARL